MSFSSVFVKGDIFPKGDISTERKRSSKRGNEFVHFSKLFHIWLKSRKQEKRSFWIEKTKFQGQYLFVGRN